MYFVELAWEKEDMVRKWLAWNVTAQVTTALDIKMIFFFYVQNSVITLESTHIKTLYFM